MSTLEQKLKETQRRRLLGQSLGISYQGNSSHHGSFYQAGISPWSLTSVKRCQRLKAAIPRAAPLIEQEIQARTSPNFTSEVTDLEAEDDLVDVCEDPLDIVEELVEVYNSTDECHRMHELDDRLSQLQQGLEIFRFGPGRALIAGLGSRPRAAAATPSSTNSDNAASIPADATAQTTDSKQHPVAQPAAAAAAAAPEAPAGMTGAAAEASSAQPGVQRPPEGASQLPEDPQPEQQQPQKAGQRQQQQRVSSLPDADEQELREALVLASELREVLLRLRPALMEVGQLASSIVSATAGEVSDAEDWLSDEEEEEGGDMALNCSRRPRNADEVEGSSRRDHQNSSGGDSHCGSSSSNCRAKGEPGGASTGSSSATHGGDELAGRCTSRMDSVSSSASSSSTLPYEPAAAAAATAAATATNSAGAEPACSAGIDAPGMAEPVQQHQQRKAGPVGLPPLLHCNPQHRLPPAGPASEPAGGAGAGDGAPSLPPSPPHTPPAPPPAPVMAFFSRAMSDLMHPKSGSSPDGSGAGPSGAGTKQPGQQGDQQLLQGEVQQPQPPQPQQGSTTEGASEDDPQQQQQRKDAAQQPQQPQPQQQQPQQHQKRELSVAERAARRAQLQSAVWWCLGAVLLSGSKDRLPLAAEEDSEWRRRPLQSLLGRTQEALLRDLRRARRMLEAGDDAHLVALEAGTLNRLRQRIASPFSRSLRQLDIVGCMRVRFGQLICSQTGLTTGTTIAMSPAGRSNSSLGGISGAVGAAAKIWLRLAEFAVARAVAEFPLAVALDQDADLEEGRAKGKGGGEDRASGGSGGSGGSGSQGDKEGGLAKVRRQCAEAARAISQTIISEELLPILAAEAVRSRVVQAKQEFISIVSDKAAALKNSATRGTATATAAGSSTPAAAAAAGPAAAAAHVAASAAAAHAAGAEMAARVPDARLEAARANWDGTEALLKLLEQQTKLLSNPASSKTGATTAAGGDGAGVAGGAVKDVAKNAVEGVPVADSTSAVGAGAKQTPSARDEEGSENGAAVGAAAPVAVAAAAGGGKQEADSSDSSSGGSGRPAASSSSFHWWEELADMFWWCDRWGIVPCIFGSSVAVSQLRRKGGSSSSRGYDGAADAEEEGPHGINRDVMSFLAQKADLNLIQKAAKELRPVVCLGGSSMAHVLRAYSRRAEMLALLPIAVHGPRIVTPEAAAAAGAAAGREGTSAVLMGIGGDEDEDPHHPGADTEGCVVLQPLGALTHRVTCGTRLTVQGKNVATLAAWLLGRALARGHGGVLECKSTQDVQSVLLACSKVRQQRLAEGKSEIALIVTPKQDVLSKLGARSGGSLLIATEDLYEHLAGRVTLAVCEVWDVDWERRSVTLHESLVSSGHDDDD